MVVVRKAPYVPSFSFSRVGSSCPEEVVTHPTRVRSKRSHRDWSTTFTRETRRSLVHTSLRGDRRQCLGPQYYPSLSLFSISSPSPINLPRRTLFFLLGVKEGTLGLYDLSLGDLRSPRQTDPAVDRLSGTDGTRTESGRGSRNETERGPT